MNIIHYGMPRRSGRYKWGSGKNPYHHGKDSGKIYSKELVQRRLDAGKTRKGVQDIINTLTPKEKEYLALDINDVDYMSYKAGEQVLHRELKMIDKVPVSFFDMLDDGNEIQITLATRSGKDYRGKGYANESAYQAMKWLNANPKKRKNRDVIWGVKEDNIGSIKLAKKLGFVEDPSSRSDGWVNYVNKSK